MTPKAHGPDPEPFRWHCKHAERSVLLAGQEEGQTKDLAVPRQGDGRTQGALAWLLVRLLCVSCDTALVAVCCHQETCPA